MIRTQIPGYPRIGARRELKRALEAFWKDDIGEQELLATGAELRRRHWRQQSDAGLDLVTTGDFSWYDQMLDHACLLGVVPARFGEPGDQVDLDTYFRMARGRSRSGETVPALEMTKWFDTNYHYLVPELASGQTFRIASQQLFEHTREALAQGFAAKPVLIGPLSFLWLSKSRGAGVERLDLLDALLPVYGEILQRLGTLGVEWVQIDEPILVLDLPQRWKNAFESAYQRLQVPGLKRMLTTYFGELGDNLNLACQLPVDGLHIDLVRAPQQLEPVLDRLPPYKVLSLGVIDGRNLWRADLDSLLDRLTPVQQRLGERLWLGTSCSLLHVPYDLAHETKLDDTPKQWLAFAVQKLDELNTLKRALNEGRASVQAQLTASADALRSRRASSHLHDAAVAKRCAAIDERQHRRASPYPERRAAQRAGLALPLLPTTTIGSFPQTLDIRRARRDFKQGTLSAADYTAQMKAHIRDTIERQEKLGLDVLVHGEPERNDMVEYFGEQLNGFAFTENGWVQSYGSRCVKPPIIYGDVSRPAPMTVDWAVYAQSLTERPVKGMLTGPVTILQWSFVRDDQPRATTCAQIALALRDEVADLEAAGIRVIQIDEPAFREGLPLRRRDWPDYLDWAARCFRLSASVVRDATQIHTHMCYAEFNDIIEAIAGLDADVITIETSRSDMELLDAFERFDYPNEIGPGVYDIHSPRVPEADEMIALIEKAARRIPPDRLWVNPDCGLKTRGWPEVEQALANMLEAARGLRERFGRQVVVEEDMAG